MRSQPNIVLVVMDTLRRDTFEDNLPRLPNTKALICESLYCENAVSPASWTIPSHASMFTGKYPGEHGMVSHFEDDAFFRSISALPERANPLAASLHNMGYSTFSVSANPLVGSGSAFQHGFTDAVTAGPFLEFEKFENAKDEILGIEKRGLLQNRLTHNLSRLEFLKRYGALRTLRFVMASRREARAVQRMDFPALKGERLVLKALEEKELPEPFFAFVNLMEMHEPYSTIPDFGDIECAFLAANLLRDFSGTALYGEELRNCKEELARNMEAVDRFLGDLVVMLKGRGCYDSTHIILTSDHGQGLGEENVVGHGYWLNDSLVNVPLALKVPGGAAGLEKRVVSTLGIYDYIMAGAEGGGWNYPVQEHVFSEEFGAHRAWWKAHARELHEKYQPEKRKRVWNKDGYSLTVNGSTGSVEDFSRSGKKMDPAGSRKVYVDLLEEMLIFTGNSDFAVPDGR